MVVILSFGRLVYKVQPTNQQVGELETIIFMITLKKKKRFCLHRFENTPISDELHVYCADTTDGPADLLVLSRGCIYLWQKKN